jgi:hypothetical protein
MMRWESSTAPSFNGLKSLVSFSGTYWGDGESALGILADVKIQRVMMLFWDVQLSIGKFGNGVLNL